MGFRAAPKPEPTRSRTCVALARVDHEFKLAAHVAPHHNTTTIQGSPRLPSTSSSGLEALMSLMSICYARGRRLKPQTSNENQTL